MCKEICTDTSQEVKQERFILLTRVVHLPYITEISGFIPT